MRGMGSLGCLWERGGELCGKKGEALGRGAILREAGRDVREAEDLQEWPGGIGGGLRVVRGGEQVPRGKSTETDSDSESLPHVPLEDVLLEDVLFKDVPLEEVLLEDVLLEDVLLEDVLFKDVPLEDVLFKDVPLEDVCVVLC
uniref:Uncharacterized protein n=1 Tax=Knipowitschia caucasica TaxID=637954 RepID=A0AAV2JL25_KNICA